MPSCLRSELAISRVSSRERLCFRSFGWGTSNGVRAFKGRRQKVWSHAVSRAKEGEVRQHQMEFWAWRILNGGLRSRAGFAVRIQREDQQAIIHLGNAMLLGVDAVDDGQQVSLVAELPVEIDDHRRRRAIQLSRTVEKRSPQRVDGSSFPRRTQLGREVGQALYNNAASQPVSCSGPRQNRGRFRFGLSLS